MRISVFDFEDYKAFLKAWLESQPKKGHGLRRSLAAASGTQTSYVTQVLSGTAHFGLEQAYAIGSHIGLSVDEQHYFLLLVQRERASTLEFRQHVERQMEEQKTRRREITNRLKAKAFPSTVDQTRYFSSWLYACVHVMTTCERFRHSRQAIAQALNISMGKVNEIVDFLIRIDLIREDNGQLSAGEARLHLDVNSPYLAKHHANWNIYALQKILTDHTGATHFSTVISLSEQDVARVREVYRRAIEEANAIVKDSPAEKICAVTLNFVEVC